MTTWNLQTTNAETGSFKYNEVMYYDDARYMYDCTSSSGYTVFWKLQTAN